MPVLQGRRNLQGGETSHETPLEENGLGTPAHSEVGKMKPEDEMKLIMDGAIVELARKGVI